MAIARCSRVERRRTTIAASRSGATTIDGSTEWLRGVAVPGSLPVSRLPGSILGNVRSLFSAAEEHHAPDRNFRWLDKKPGVTTRGMSELDESAQRESEQVDLVVAQRCMEASATDRNRPRVSER